MDRPPQLSAIILGYRSGSHLGPLARSFYGTLEMAGVEFEMILVGNYDAGDASDETPQVCAAVSADLSRARAVAEPKRGGMGWDMRSGLGAARGDFLVVIDGDGQNPVDDVLRAYERHRETGADLVIGRRVVRGDGIVRKLVSSVYNRLFALMFGTWDLSDVNGKPKGMTRSALERMQLNADDWFIDAEIVLEARRLGLRIEEFPVRFLENRHRSSFVRWRTVGEFVVNMVKRRLGGVGR